MFSGMVSLAGACIGAVSDAVMILMGISESFHRKDE